MLVQKALVQLTWEDFVGSIVRELLAGRHVWAACHWVSFSRVFNCEGRHRRNTSTFGLPLSLPSRGEALIWSRGQGFWHKLRIGKMGGATFKENCCWRFWFPLTPHIGMFGKLWFLARQSNTDCFARWSELETWLIVFHSAPMLQNDIFFDATLKKLNVVPWDVSVRLSVCIALKAKHSQVLSSARQRVHNANFHPSYSNLIFMW